MLDRSAGGSVIPLRVARLPCVESQLTRMMFLSYRIDLGSMCVVCACWFPASVSSKECHGNSSIGGVNQVTQIGDTCGGGVSILPTHQI